MAWTRWGYRFETEDIKKAEFPVIIYWKFNHFVVLDGLKKDYAVLNYQGYSTRRNPRGRDIRRTDKKGRYFAELVERQRLDAGPTESIF